MLRERKNKKLLKLSLAFLAAVILSAMQAGCSKDKPGPPPPAQNQEQQQTSAQAKPIRPAPEVIRGDKLNVTLLVNDTRYIALPSGTPVFVQCIIENPLGESADMDQKISPVITDADDKAIDAKWQVLCTSGSKIAAGKLAVVAWRLTSSLEPGDYRITLIGELGSGKKVKLTLARLEITSAEADEKLQIYYRRRLLALEGKNTQLLAELDKAIAKAPDDLSLQRQRVDALELAGRYEDALDQLRSMGMAMQEKSKDEMHPVPDWVVFRELRLREIIAANKKKTEADDERK